MTGCKDDYIIGIDIGGTYFRIGIQYRDGAFGGFAVESSSILGKNDRQLENLTDYIRKYMEKYGTGKLLAISIGFPSAVSKDKKMVFQSPNLVGFNDVNIGDLLGAAFGVPVFVDNDVNNLLIYEIVERNLENSGIVIGIYYGTGLGNAICINGDILEGKHGTAGELGHIPVLGKTDACGCGNLGCMEMYASGKKLVEIQRRHFPATEIKDVFQCHGEEPVIQEFVETLSIPIAVEMNILDPDYIIVGGGVAGMEGFPRDALEKFVYQHARKPYPAEDFRILYASGSRQSGVKGAAYNAYKRLKTNFRRGQSDER